MRAAVLTTPGESPTHDEHPDPTPGPGCTLVRVTAAPIVPLDLLCASGTSYFGRPATPYVPGVQGVGVVERGTDRIAPGIPVWFATPAGMAPGDGSMRERACAAEHDVVPLPPGSDQVLVAALGLSAVAAWMALTWRGELAAGERVVVLGAGGTVGQAAVQLARLAGAGQVIAVARAAEALERAVHLGADAAVALHPIGTLTDRIAQRCDGPVDLVLDPLFGDPAAAALRTLRPHGRLVNLGSSAAETAPIESAVLRGRSLRVLGYTNAGLTPEQRRDALTVVAEHAAAGRLTVTHQPVPLAEAATAWTRPGRVVLIPDPPSQ